MCPDLFTLRSKHLVVQCNLMDSMPAPEASGSSRPSVKSSRECGECGAAILQPIPFNQRILIKSLLRAIAMANYAQAASVCQLAPLSRL